MQRSHISKDDLLAVAKLIGIKRAAKIFTQVSDVINCWKDYAEEQKVPVKLREAIKETLLPM